MQIAIKIGRRQVQNIPGRAVDSTMAMELGIHN